MPMPAPGEPTVTVLLRHGQTPLSVEKRYAGTSDVPLTEVGVRQAVAAARRLASAGIGAIVTSPLQRAVRTAEEVAAVTGVPVVTDGPYAETEEVLAGYWIVECDSFDRATEIAARLAGCPGPVDAASAFADVRPIAESRAELDC